MTSAILSSLKEALEKYGYNKDQIRLCKNAIIAGSREFTKKFSVLRAPSKPASSFVKTPESINKSSEDRSSEDREENRNKNWSGSRHGDSLDPLEISYKSFNFNVVDNYERLFRFLCFRLHPDKCGNNQDSLSLFLVAKKARDSKNWTLLTEVYFDYVYISSCKKYSGSNFELDLEEVKALTDNINLGITFQEKLISHLRSNPFYLYSSAKDPSDKMKVEVDIIRFYTDLGRKRR